MNKTARQSAEEKFTQTKSKEAAALKGKKAAQQLRDDKVDRLRGLRLAKEAADREAAALAKAAKAARKPRKKAPNAAAAAELVPATEG